MTVTLLIITDDPLGESSEHSFGLLTLGSLVKFNIKEGRERWFDGEKSKMHSSFNESRRPCPKPITWSTTAQMIVNNQTALIIIRNWSKWNNDLKQITAWTIGNWSKNKQSETNQKKPTIEWLNQSFNQEKSPGRDFSLFNP